LTGVLNMTINTESRWNDRSSWSTVLLWSDSF